MAIFEPAFKKTMGNEGGYCNDPDDRGGETYRGIARNMHPDWDGWGDVDDLKAKNIPSKEWIDLPLLQARVKIFYKKLFWDIFLGDSIKNQAIAEELFDSGVNFGPGIEVKFLQRSINLTSTKDIAVDGKCGPATIAALNALSVQDQTTILKILNILQGNRYVEIAEKNPSQRKFIDGWFTRVNA